jgi:hypothetical protein
MTSVSVKPTIIELDEVGARALHAPRASPALVLLARLAHARAPTAGGAEMQAALQELTGQRTVPNVFIGGKQAGGNDGVSAPRLLCSLDCAEPRVYSVPGAAPAGQAGADAAGCRRAVSVAVPHRRDPVAAFSACYGHRTPAALLGQSPPSCMSRATRSDTALTRVWLAHW